MQANTRVTLSGALILVLLSCPALSQEKKQEAEPYYEWKVVDYAINEPLGGLKGDPDRGRKIAVHRKKGNCLACHVMPIPGTEFHGNLGPPLTGLASRLTEGQMRLRIVDQKQVNPATVMPGYYRNPKHFNRVRKQFKGKTVLSAQEVEDVVALMMTFK